MSDQSMSKAYSDRILELEAEIDRLTSDLMNKNRMMDIANDRIAKLEASFLEIRNYSRPEARETQSQATVRGYVRKIDAIAIAALEVETYE